MAILNRFPSGGGGSGVLVPGEEYVGFVPEKLSSAEGLPTISIEAGMLVANPYIILKDHSNATLILPSVIKGESNSVILTGSDSSRAAVTISRATSSFTGRMIKVACADTTKDVSLYVKEFGYGGFADKTVTGSTVEVTIKRSNSSGELYYLSEGIAHKVGDALIESKLNLPKGTVFINPGSQAKITSSFEKIDIPYTGYSLAVFVADANGSIDIENLHSGGNIN